MENLKITQTIAKPDSLIIRLGIYIAAFLVFGGLFSYLTIVWMQPLNWFMLAFFLIFASFAISNIFYLIQYKKGKRLPAIFNSETLTFEGGVTINSKDIKKVSATPMYDKASVKQMKNNNNCNVYGTLKIKTDKKTYKLYFVENVIEVKEYIQHALNLDE